MSKMPYTVVVGVDGSVAGLAALQWAMSEARCRRGRVRAIHAWTSPYDWPIEVRSPIDEAPVRDTAQRLLDGVLAEVDVGGVPVEGALVEGEPQAVLLDAAKHADLLVVGSHGRGRVAEVLLRSVSMFCVRHATGPVVVVHGGTDPEEPGSRPLPGCVRSPAR